MAYDALIFDLDGTLWDAAVASTHAWNRALAEMGVPNRVTLEDVRSVSGHPFPRCVEILLPELHPAPPELVEFLLTHEREGIERLAGVLYEGVADGLPRLAKVYRLFVVSNCPDWYLEKFFRFSGLDGYISGYDCHGSSGVGKSSMLANMRERYNFRQAAYVGDTQGDRDAAEAAGMEFVFARYGFGATTAPGLSFDSFGDLVEHFLNSSGR